MTVDDRLLNSAKSFLIEGLKNHRDSRDRFAILHTVIAVELAIKERLVRINPALIFRDIDSKTLQESRTVGLADLPRRLANLGCPLDPKEAALVQQFAEWRNQIVHHYPTYDEGRAGMQLPGLLNFLAEFINRELGTPLAEFLPTSLYRPAEEMLEKWRKVIEVVRARAAEEGNVSVESCPGCGIGAVVCLRADAKAYCHSCHTVSAWICCSLCERPTLEEWTTMQGESWCVECQGRIGEE